MRAAKFTLSVMIWLFAITWVLFWLELPVILWVYLFHHFP